MSAFRYRRALCKNVRAFKQFSSEALDYHAIAQTFRIPLRENAVTGLPNVAYIS
jgi:hypothetical protein